MPHTVNGKIIPAADVKKLESSGGKPLSTAIKNTLEAKFNTDLSNVRVHEGPNAARLTATVGAKAFTLGNHVVFQPGLFDTQEGQRLLAHELTHVVQQGSSTPSE